MKLLILRTGAMGDIVHALHGLPGLRQAHPDWTIHWLADERWAPLLVDRNGYGPEVHRAITAPLRAWSREPFAKSTRTSLARLRQTLRAEHYDLAVDLQGTIRSGVLGFLSGAKTLAGWTDPRERPARWFYNEAIPREGTHFAEQTTALLAAATRTPLDPGNLEPGNPRFPAPPAELRWAEEQRSRMLAETGADRLVLLAPGAGWAAKQWPAERYGELALRLREDNYAVAINAAVPGHPLARTVAEASRGAATPLPTDLSQLIAMLRLCDLVIGGDTGPLHLAAALKIPLIGLYGPTDPARNGPFGVASTDVLRHPSSLTSYKRSTHPDEGLSQLTVDDVLAAIDLHMHRGPIVPIVPRGR